MCIVISRIKNCKISHNTGSSLILKWNDLLCCARKNRKEQKWIVEIIDALSHEDIDFATSVNKVVDSDNELEEAIIQLGCGILAKREV